MWKVLQILGEVVKSNLVQNILGVVIGTVADPYVHTQVAAAANTAAANSPIAHSASAVIDAIVPALTTWTPDELATAETAWAATQATGTISPNSAFTAGVAWAIGHQTSSLQTGLESAIAEAAAKSLHLPSSVVQEVETDVVGVAEAAVTGGAAGAATTAATDVVQAVEQAANSEVDHNSTPSTPPAAA